MSAEHMITQQPAARPSRASWMCAAGCSARLSIRVRELEAENARLLAERDATERFISHIEALCEHGCREEAAYCPEGTGLLEAWGRARMTSEKPA